MTATERGWLEAFIEYPEIECYRCSAGRDEKLRRCALCSGTGWVRRSMQFGVTLMAWRHLCKCWSQRDLAYAMGVTEVAVSGWENGRHGLSKKNKRKAIELMVERCGAERVMAALAEDRTIQDPYVPEHLRA